VLQRRCGLQPPTNIDVLDLGTSRRRQVTSSVVRACRQQAAGGLERETMRLILARDEATTAGSGS
jgi:hypothetical protein